MTADTLSSLAHWGAGLGAAGCARFERSFVCSARRSQPPCAAQWRLDGPLPGHGEESTAFRSSTWRAPRRSRRRFAAVPTRASSPRSHRASKSVQRPVQSGSRLGRGLQALMGRIMSYAFRCFTPATPAIRRAPSFSAGHAGEGSPSLHGELLFFELELDRLDNTRLDAATPGIPPLTHARPSLVDIRMEQTAPAQQRACAIVPRKVNARTAQCGTYSSTRRWPRCGFPSTGEELTLEPLLGKLQDADSRRARSGGDGAGQDARRQSSGCSP